MLIFVEFYYVIIKTSKKSKNSMKGKGDTKWLIKNSNWKP